MIDAVPENAEFVLNSELLQLASIHGAKVRDLKSLFAFRLLLKKRNAEFRKTIGKPPQDDQSKLFLWNAFDPESKRLAAAENVAGMNYDDMAKWIDERHRIIYGTLDYKPLTKDDPMGLALFADAQLSELNVDPSPRLRPQLTRTSRISTPSTRAK